MGIFDLIRLLRQSAPAEDGSGCRRWQGHHNAKGYGQISWQGRRRAVHAVAHELWIGPIPEGLEIDHVAARGCRWRDCINPDHLEAVTHAENLARSEHWRTNWVPPTHCPRGHELTDANRKMKTRRGGKWRPTTLCRRCVNDYKIAWNAARKAKLAGGSTKGGTP